MGSLGDRLCEQTTLVVAHIARGRPDQTADRVTLHVLGHIKAYQLNPQGPCQLTADFGFAHPGGPGKHEAADGFILAFKPRPGQFDGRRNSIDGFILPEHRHLKVALEIAEQLLV